MKILHDILSEIAQFSLLKILNVYPTGQKVVVRFFSVASNSSHRVMNVVTVTHSSSIT